jgi:hypothetical protein
VVLYRIQADIQLPGDLGFGTACKDEGKTSFSFGVSRTSLEVSLVRAAASSSFSEGRSQTRRIGQSELKDEVVESVADVFKTIADD